MATITIKTQVKIGVRRRDGGLLTTSDHVFVLPAAAPTTVDTPVQNTDRPTQPVLASRT
jgi:hypothetical protein